MLLVLYYIYAILYMYYYRFYWRMESGVAAEITGSMLVMIPSVHLGRRYFAR